MLIEIGHSHPVDGSVVTQTRISDAQNEQGEYLSSYTVGTDAQDVRDHLFDNPGLVTHLPGNTAILDVVGPQRERLNGDKPLWVTVDSEGRPPEVAADFERFLSGFYRCPAGRPVDVEETHWTLHDGTVFAPGDKPESEDV